VNSCSTTSNGATTSAGMSSPTDEPFAQHHQMPMFTR
jgi:hypothetical protein